jgi:hypothetical protein
MVLTEWMGITTKINNPKPPKSEQIMVNLQMNKNEVTEFADGMIQAVHGKSYYGGERPQKNCLVTLYP